MLVSYSWRSFLQGFRLDIQSLITNANPFIIASCFVALTVIFLLLERKPLRPTGVLFALAASVYGTFLLTITLLGRAAGNSSSWGQMFSIYARAFSGDLGAVFDVFYNIVLFIPVGLLAARYPRTKAVIIALLCIPLGIELLQLITSRGVFEISDIINNFIGGLIGLGVARLIAKLFRRMTKKSK